MAFYLDLERKVISVMEDCLAELGFRNVLMEGGFMTERKIGRDHLEREVKAMTGFDVSLSEAVIGLSSDMAEIDEAELKEIEE